MGEKGSSSEKFRWEEGEGRKKARAFWSIQGIGQLLYKELSQRLQNVGVTTIFCWADKVSERFWLKQGFVSVGEVDAKGKVRRIPVRADIRGALCFPGGSTLMVTHLKKALLAPQEISLDKLQTSQLHDVAQDSMSPGDTRSAVPSCENLVTETFGCHNVSKTGNGGRSLSDQHLKKRAYETSSSSLKSKRIRCSCHADHHQAHGESKISEAKNANCSNGSPSVMLMNIADETKRSRLTEVVKMLGGFVTSEGNSCTHVISGKARRTMNFCIALCSGAWIVSPNWLKESFKQGKFVGEAEYVLEDEEYKMQYKSELRDAVKRAKERPCWLFSGYNFCLTKYIQPSVDVLSTIIKSSGGKIIKKLDGLDDPSKTIFLACEEDMELALDAAKRGIKTFSSDWFMSCVMRQELDLEAHQFTESLMSPQL